MWLDLAARGWELVAAGFLCLVGVGLWQGRGGRHSCAPTDSEEWEDGDAWDRGHDRWIDEQNEVA